MSRKIRGPVHYGLMFQRGEYKMPCGGGGLNLGINGDQPLRSRFCTFFLQLLKNKFKNESIQT